MDKELQDLKSVLRSLVVSSPAQVDVRSLACDYRNMMGSPIPLAKYGYRDILTFLKERCGDCFLGVSSNPVLTLIVPDSLKHIDQFVQRQKCTSNTKLKGKRRSVVTPIRPPEKPKFESNRICQTFTTNNALKQNFNYQFPQSRSNYNPPEVKSNYHPPDVKSKDCPPDVKSNYCPTEVKPNKYHSSEVKSNYHPPDVKSKDCPPDVKSNYCPTEVKPNKYHSSEVKSNYHPPDVKSKYYPPDVKSNYCPKEVKPNKYHSSEVKSNYHPPDVKSKDCPPDVKSNYCPTEVKPNKYHSSEVKSNYHPPDVKSKYYPPDVKSNYCPTEVKSNKSHSSEVKLNYHPPEVKPNGIKSKQLTENCNLSANNKYNRTTMNQITSDKPDSNQIVTCDKPENNVRLNPHRDDHVYNRNVSSLLKRCQQMYETSNLDREECTEPDKVSSKGDNDSGRQTSSSQSSTKKAQLEELKCEVYELIKEHENGILCTNILRFYRERYSRELNLSQFHHHNINSLLSSMDDCVAFVQEAGGVRVRDAQARVPPPRPGPRPRPLPPLHASLPLSHSRHTLPVDPDDALPGIAYEADVFPADCMQFMDSIPAPSLDGICAGAMVEVAVGEVYSPSHFWLQRVGPGHSFAMDDLMDAMCEYYNSGAGRERVLARGAVRPGQYCAAIFERDWHRSTIVKIVDADTVKVRHVDYGTVDSVPVSSLKPLLCCWAQLPAQGLRARLAGLRPGAGGRRWPHAAAAHFLHLVRDRHFIANVVAVDLEEETIETFLIDTSGADDVCLSAELVRAGHADQRADSALGVSGVSTAAPPAPSHVDVRTLARNILRFSVRAESACSEVSASASELVGAPPRRMPPWEPPDTCAARSPPDTLLSAAAGSRRLLARMRALSDLEHRLEASSDVPAPVPAACPRPDTVVTATAPTELSAPSAAFLRRMTMFVQCASIRGEGETRDSTSTASSSPARGGGASSIASFLRRRLEVHRCVNGS